MKKINLIIIAIVSLLSSCKKFIDVNTNPNVALAVPSKVLLPTTTVGLAWANGNLLGLCTSLWMQYNAGVSSIQTQYDVYEIASASFNSDWSESIYTGCVNNLKQIISQSEEDDPAYSGIAKIQLAYIISLATDLWGDVPYSQAGLGEEYTQPRFDKQADIYQGNTELGITSLFDLVSSGMADLDKPSVSTPGTDDLIYNGDLAKWKSAGNSLILKLANTISGVNAALAKSKIEEVLNSTSGYITSGTDNLQVPFSTETNNQNPIYGVDRTGIYKNGQLLSSRFLSLSRSLNDTLRLSKLYTKPNGVFTAYENGSSASAPALASRSVYTSYVVGTSGEAPIRLLTDFQSKFILAESVIALGVDGDANALYQAGIKASMTGVGMTASEIDSYFNANPDIVNLSGSVADQQKQIITQKYIAWVGNGIESYNDYRRTGYPELVPALNAVGDNNGQIPLRVLYTTTEGNANSNQPNPIPTESQKVWWGK